MSEQDAAEAARLLSARRPIRTQTCQWCGKPFGAREAARYCSQRCRSAAWKSSHQESEFDSVVRGVRRLLSRLPKDQRIEVLDLVQRLEQEERSPQAGLLDFGSE